MTPQLHQIITFASLGTLAEAYAIVSSGHTGSLLTPDGVTMLAPLDPFRPLLDQCPVSPDDQDDQDPRQGADGEIGGDRLWQIPRSAYDPNVVVHPAPVPTP